MKNPLPMLALVALPFLGFAGNAHALAQNATSHKYFDENGALVGQDIRLCSALSYHAGNTHTAYLITEETNCIGNPGLDYIVPNTIITSYTLPGFLSISTACGVAECEHAGVAEPSRLLDKGWTWTNP
ncbi:hypothetical protein J2T07_001656 [Luteibacter jiangsuensis]|uniref:Uncharacterized protein n=1 Tax=Luteibacter jiangsuensis TaxID=637577 RepID=A0ABT9SWU9_9GAMM|nr:hypothetical protein [Luteibacter jiangsuensis]MDQ0009479.1 hypothetical protein [Luteibacter jiangsuensis]